MPQLLPFFFMNQVIFVYILLIIILYALLKHIYCKLSNTMLQARSFDIKWLFSKPPKPHYFVSLPLQSAIDKSWLNISESDWNFIVSQLNKLESEIRVRLQKLDRKSVV